MRPVLTAYRTPEQYVKMDGSLSESMQFVASLLSYTKLERDDLGTSSSLLLFSFSTSPLSYSLFSHTYLLDFPSTVNFHLFSEFPSEIRCKIWREAFRDPCEVNLATLPNFPFAQRATIPPAQLPPTTLSVCQESREETLRHYSIVYHDDEWRRGQRRALIFDQNRDLVVLPLTVNGNGEAMRQLNHLASQIEGGFSNIRNLELRETAVGGSWTSGGSLTEFTKGILQLFPGLHKLQLFGRTFNNMPAQPVVQTIAPPWFQGFVQVTHVTHQIQAGNQSGLIQGVVLQAVPQSGPQAVPQAAPTHSDRFRPYNLTEREIIENSFQIWFNEMRNSPGAVGHMFRECHTVAVIDESKPNSVRAERSRLAFREPDLNFAVRTNRVRGDDWLYGMHISGSCRGQDGHAVDVKTGIMTGGKGMKRDGTSDTLWLT